MASAVPALIGAGVSLIGSKRQSDATKDAAKAATPVAYSGTGPAGSTQFNSATKQFDLQLGQNPFFPMFQSIGASSLANSATAPGSFLYGADPELADAYKGTFGQGLTSEIQDRYNLLGQIAQPGEQRAFQGLQDRLYGQGRLGTSGGGIEQEAFQSALMDADLKRSLAAQDYSQTNALNRFSGALQAVGSGQAGSMNQFNQGTGAFGSLQNALQGLYSQANVGLGAATGTPASVAMAQAQAAGVPYQAANQFLSNSGAYDWLGGKIAGAFGGGGTPAATSLPGGTANFGFGPTAMRDIPLSSFGG